MERPNKLISFHFYAALLNVNFLNVLITVVVIFDFLLQKTFIPGSTD